jgi:hypothetical protein
VGAEDHRDPGGVDEGAALQADQDPFALLAGLEQDLVELAGNREIELPFDLDVAGAALELALADFETLHHRESPIVIDGMRPGGIAAILALRAT